MVDEDGMLKLRLGSQPIILPTPLDALLRELIEQRPPWAVNADDPGWLFPGRNHGQPIHPQVLARRLKKGGASTRDGRNTALMHLAATLPTKVLSDLLGLSLAGAAAGACWPGQATPTTRQRLLGEVPRAVPVRRVMLGITGSSKNRGSAAAV